MLRYTIRRLLWLPVILLGVSIITFAMLRGLPGQDPATRIAGGQATEEQLEELRERLGLNDPVFPVSIVGSPPFIQFNENDQYTQWLRDVLSGDFGNTYQSQRPIRDEFIDRLPLSFQLVLISVTISVILGIGFGVISAIFRNRGPDYGIRGFAVLGASVPDFFLLALLIVIPSYLWRYSIPVGDNVGLFEDPVRNMRLIMPAAIILGVTGAAPLMRLVRTSMLEVLRSDYVRTARAKGLNRNTVIVSHALRNAGTPILTAMGTAFIALFGGSIIAERVLSIRGIGLWFFESTLIADLPVIQFLAIYTAAVVIIVNLIVDLSYAWADPRIRYS
jgi:peptide/nickel transport system permease protein